MGFQIFIMMNVFVAVARSLPIPNEYPQQKVYPWRTNSLDDGKLTAGKIRSVLRKFQNNLVLRPDGNLFLKHNARKTNPCGLPSGFSNDVESVASYSGSNPCVPVKKHHSKHASRSRLMRKTMHEYDASSNDLPFGK